MLISRILRECDLFLYGSGAGRGKGGRDGREGIRGWIRGEMQGRREGFFGWRRG